MRVERVDPWYRFGEPLSRAERRELARDQHMNYRSNEMTGKISVIPAAASTAAVL
jgi:hypothetical protein